MALTTAFTVSAALVVVVALGGAFALFSSRQDYTFFHFQLTRDGTLYKVTRHGYDAPEIVDLSGQPLLDEKTGQKIKLPEFQKRSAFGMSVSVRFGESQKRNAHREQYLDTARFFSPWRVWDKTLWYLTHDGRLVGYHGVTRRQVGSLEPSKVPAGGALIDSRFLRPQDYAFSYLNPYVQPEILTTAKTAYLVDLEKRELKPLFRVTNSDAIGGYSQNLLPHFPAASNQVMVVTRSAILLLDFEGKVLMRVPYQPAYPAYPTVSVFSLEPTNAFAVRFDPDYLLNKKSGGKLLSRVEWVNADGSVRDAMDLPKLPEPRQDNTAERLGIPLLPPAFPIYTWEPQDRIWNLLRIVPAVVCAWIGWGLGRRNNFSPKAKVGWGVFHLLFGIPGLLAFLAVQEGPARESCPKCRKLRAVNREQCEHCGAAFLPAERTGTEIFEPLTTR